MRAALIALLAVAWFGTLGLRPLYKADESRYGEIPREMVASGDWLTPRLNGFKYFEKPPLQYWGTAAFFSLFGVHDWVARLWTALAGFAGILLVLHAGNRLFGPPAGTFAAAVLAGSPYYVSLAQLNTLDMGLTFFFTAALVALAAGHVLLFWVACALAVLSKGLIGIVLPLGTIALYVLVRRDWGLLKKLEVLKGIPLFLLICAPWFIAVSIANPEFARFFFIHEHFERFTSEVHQRQGPPWYFLPFLAAGMLPWALPAAIGWWKGLRSRGESLDPALLFALWALVVLVFFSASGSKLPAYILPIVPALALLTGRYLAVPNRKILLVQAAIFAATGLAVAVVLPGRGGEAYAAYVPWLVAAGAITAACSVFALVKKDLSVIALATGGFLATQLALIGHATIAERFSAAGLIAAVEPLPPASAPVYAVDAYDHSLPWYLRRTVTMVAYRDEFGPAIEWDPKLFVPDLATFEAAWRSQREAYAIVGAGGFAGLSARLPMQQLARDARYVFVRKP